MPYRRLPKTDVARQKALSIVVEKSFAKNIANGFLPIDLLYKARTLLQNFNVALDYYKACSSQQVKRNKKHIQNSRKARLYVSHFIQVLNMCVLREEIKEEDKALYKLDPKDYNLPDMTNDEKLKIWGKNIIEGEELRKRQGGVPIYNPTIARVRVFYELFVDSYHDQEILQLNSDRGRKKLNELIPNVDALILEIWNRIEEEYNPKESVDNLNKCREYGVVYYYRKGEKNEE